MADSKYIPYVPINGKFQDIAGQRFGKLIAVEPLRKIGRGGAYWRCACDCGGEAISTLRDILRGKSQTCGCSRRIKLVERNTTHGLSQSPTYQAWINLRDRCDNPKNKQYADYGGRGITYDPAWLLFEYFLEDMGEAPVGLQIDRERNDGNYCKENCRWVTRLVNANNKRNNRMLTFNGRTTTLAELARIVGIDHRVLYRRLGLGWTVERAATEPVKTRPAAKGWQK